MPLSLGNIIWKKKNARIFLKLKFYFPWDHHLWEGPKGLGDPKRQLKPVVGTKIDTVARNSMINFIVISSDLWPHVLTTWVTFKPVSVDTSS